MSLGGKASVVGTVCHMSHMRDVCRDGAHRKQTALPVTTQFLNREQDFSPHAGQSTNTQPSPQDHTSASMGTTLLHGTHCGENKTP